MRIFPTSFLYRYDAGMLNLWRIIMMEDGSYLELKLTPINTGEDNSHSSEDWNYLSQGELMFHPTKPSYQDGDKLGTAISPDDENKMKQMLGEETAEYFLRGDIWNSIDWNRFTELDQWGIKLGKVTLSDVQFD